MRKELTVAIDAAKKAGRLAAEMRAGEAVESFEKSKNNMVTNADFAAEELIVETIAREFKAHSFLAEERHETASRDAENLWVIDPLDGTNNYAHGIPHFCVSIAYAQRGEIACGAVFDPLRDECFTAAKGEGAFLNGKRIAASSRGRLDQSIIATGFAYDRGHVMEETLESIRRLFKADIRGIRRTGSAALDMCWVAGGRFDGYFEYLLSPWDFSAGKIIVTEAGGACCDKDGAALTLTSTSIVTSNGKIHEEFLAKVKWRG